MDYAPVDMIRQDLAGIPQFELPPSYSARWYRPRDEEAWLRIQMAADRFNTFTPRTFEEQFGTDERVIAQRQCYLCDAGGAPFGTTTAWFNNYQGRPHGRIHWVAIVPEMQGKGLARPMMTLACNRLRELGHERAYLDSATVRTAALNLYLKFGFLPIVRNERDREAWLALRPHIRPEYWRQALQAVPGLAPT